MTTRVEFGDVPAFRVGDIWESNDGTRWRIADVNSPEYGSDRCPVKAIDLSSAGRGRAMHFTPEGIWSADFKDYGALNLVKKVVWRDANPHRCVDPELTKTSAACLPPASADAQGILDRPLSPREKIAKVAEAYGASPEKVKELLDPCQCGMVKFGFIGHAGYCPEFKTLAQMRVALTTPDPVPDYLTPGDLKGAAQRSSK